VANGMLQTHLCHVETNESIVSEVPMPQGLSPQQLGSFITYMKRYSIGAMLALATDEDDDANHANKSKVEQKQPPKSNKKLLSNDHIIKSENKTVLELSETPDGLAVLARLFYQGINGIKADFEPEIKKRLGAINESKWLMIELSKADKNTIKQLHSHVIEFSDKHIVEQFNAQAVLLGMEELVI
jgi:hypothetical protein